MASVTIELPPQAALTGFNLRRWAKLVEDPELAGIEGRIETDRHGQIIMSPPPAASHSRFEFRIAYLLQHYLPHGEVLTECPISTADGVKAADVAWASPECMRTLGNRVCFPRAPEICVEVLSPRNTKAAMEEKFRLYFDAGAVEVWTCAKSGTMTFFGPKLRQLNTSAVCPQFPKHIKLP